jgi:FlaG/FlaF family flagellin (archaellin)
MFFSRFVKIFVIVLIAFVFATVATAFAASNTVPSSAAGEGAGAVSGYTVTNVQYQLNASNPANIDSVTFTLNAAATTVRIKLVSSGSTYYNCTNSGGNNWSCTTTGATVAPSDELRVIAAN